MVSPSVPMAFHAAMGDQTSKVSAALFVTNCVSAATAACWSGASHAALMAAPIWSVMSDHRRA
jgi:hypothetical protein